MRFHYLITSFLLLATVLAPSQTQPPEDDTTPTGDSRLYNEDPATTGDDDPENDEEEKPYEESEQEEPVNDDGSIGNGDDSIPPSTQRESGPGNSEYYKIEYGPCGECGVTCARTVKSQETPSEYSDYYYFDPDETDPGEEPETGSFSKTFDLYGPGNLAIGSVRYFTHEFANPGRIALTASVPDNFTIDTTTLPHPDNGLFTYKRINSIKFGPPNDPNAGRIEFVDAPPAYLTLDPNAFVAIEKNFANQEIRRTTISFVNEGGIDYFRMDVDEHGTITRHQQTSPALNKLVLEVGRLSGEDFAPLRRTTVTKNFDDPNLRKERWTIEERPTTDHPFVVVSDRELWREAVMKPDSAKALGLKGGDGTGTKAGSATKPTDAPTKPTPEVGSAKTYVQDSTGKFYLRNTPHHYWRVIREIIDPAGANPLVNTWQYYHPTDTAHPGFTPYAIGRIKSYQRYDGSQASFTYGLNRDTVTRPYAGNPQGMVTTAEWNPSTRTRVLTRSVNNQEISRTVITYTNTRLTYTQSTSASESLTTVIDYKPDSQLFGGFPTRILHSDGTLTTHSYSRGTTGGIITTTETGSTENDTAVNQGLRTLEVTNSRGNTIFRETQAIGHGNAEGKIYERMAVTQIDDRGRPEVTLWHPATASHQGEIAVAADPAWQTSTVQFCCGPYSVTDQYGITTTYAYDGLKRPIKTNRLGVTTETVRLGLTTETHRYPQIVDENNALMPNLAGTSETLVSRSTRNLTGTEMVSGSPDPSAVDTQGDGIPGALADTTTEITYQPAAGLSRRTTTTVPGGHQQITDSFLNGRTAKTSGALSPAMEYEYSVNSIGEITSQSFLNTENSKLETSTQQVDRAGRTVQTAKGTIVTNYTYFNATAPRGSRGQLASITDADGVTTRHAYNAKGERTINANKLDNNSTAITYGTDRVTSSETIPAVRDGAPVWRTTSKVWKDGDTNANAGTIVSVTDQSPNGLQSWTWTLGTGPAFGAPTAIYATSSTVLGKDTTTGFGNGSWTTTQTNPDNTKQLQVYTEGLLSVVSFVDSINIPIATTSYAYDPLNRPVTTTDSRTGPTTTTYLSTTADAVKSITEPGNRTTSYKYDNRGRRTHVDAPNSVDANNTVLENITITTYNPDGTIAQVSGGQTYPVSYTYDYADRMKTMTTTGAAGNAITAWNYSATTGQLVSKRYASNLQGSTGTGPDYDYTAAGRLESRQWARSLPTQPGVRVQASYSYTHGLLTGITYNDGTPNVVLDYDALTSNNNHIPGDLETVTQNGATWTLSYDSTNLRLLSETHPVGGTAAERILARQYDSLGRPAGFQLGVTADPDADHATTYDYDNAGRLAEVTSPAGVFTYGFVNQAPHLIATISGPADMLVTNQWKADRDVLHWKKNEVDSTPVSQFTYGVNPIGQRENVVTTGTEFDNSNRGWQWGYDALGQATKAAHAADNTLDRSYAYDSIGNRLQSGTGVSPAAITSYTPNLLNQYSSIENPQSSIVNPVHDLDGNLREDAGINALSYGLKYEWDAENRITAVRKADDTLLATYTYDPFSRRIRKTTTAAAHQGASDTAYLYDGWNVVAEYSNSSLNTENFELKTTYTWGLDLSGTLQGAGGVGGLLAVAIHDPQSAIYYPTYDGNGNVSEYIKDDGTTAAHFEYDPFGRIVHTTGTPAAFTYRFSTKPQDFETGLLYYGYRYYDPVTGRWPSRDPIGERGGVNLYGFVGNDGVNWIDILGLNPSSDSATFPVTQGDCTVSVFWGHGSNAMKALRLQNNQLGINLSGALGCSIDGTNQVNNPRDLEAVLKISSR